jgi:pimeloyl-ACP methyl ester carboxylesterase
MAAVKDFAARALVIGRTHWHLHASTATPDNAGPTVVFVPGLGEGDYMAAHGRILAKHWPVWIVDMPGFGRTRRPERLRSVEQFADALEQFLRVALDEPAYLVASSFGCQIAAAAAEAKAPIAAMVLVSPTSDAGARSIVGQLRRWLPTMLAEPPGLAIGLTKSYLHCGIRTPIVAFLAGLRDHLEDRVPNVDVPTLVVRGARDHIVSAAWARLLVDRLPCGQLATIDGFAHTLDYAAPGQLARVTVPFLAGCWHAQADDRRRRADQEGG